MPHLQTTDGESGDRRRATAGYGGVALRTVAARAIQKARWCCTGQAAVCSSDEEILASFVREVVAVNLLKVKGHLDLGCRKIAGMIGVGGEKSAGFRRSLGSRKTSIPPRARRRSAKRCSRGRGWTLSKPLETRKRHLAPTAAPHTTQRLIDAETTMVGRKPMRRRRSERAPPPPPPSAPSFGATARPTSPRNSTSTPASAAAVAADLDELLLAAPPPLASEPRSFPYAVKQQCWEKAERVPGRDPERWRRDSLGNVVFRKLVGCPGCLCHDYDHIVPYSKGGKSTLENCQVLQATVNQSKGNKTEVSKSELIQKSAYCRVSGRDMDLVELSAYGNVRRGPDSGGCNIQ